MQYVIMINFSNVFTKYYLQPRLISIKSDVSFEKIWYNVICIIYNKNNNRNEIYVNLHTNKIVYFNAHTKKYCRACRLDFTKEKVDYCLEKLEYINNILEKLMDIPGKNKYGIFYDFHLSLIDVHELHKVVVLFNKIFSIIDYNQIINKPNLTYIYYKNNKFCVGNDEYIKEYYNLDEYIQYIKC